MYYGFDYGFSNPYEFYSSTPAIPNVWSYFGFVLLIFAVAFIGMAVAGACYALKSYSLYRLGCRRKMKSSFLAFFPVANNYYLGYIADDINRTMNRRTNYAQKILVLSVASVIVACVWLPLAALTMLLASHGFFVAVLWVLLTLVFMAVSVTAVVYYYIALNTVFKEYALRNATLYTVLSVLVSVAAPILLFVIRNKKSGYELWLEQREAEAIRAKEEAERQNAEPVECDTVSEEQAEPDNTCDVSDEEQAEPEETITVENDAPSDETVEPESERDFQKRG